MTSHEAWLDDFARELVAAGGRGGVDSLAEARGLLAEARDVIERIAAITGWTPTGHLDEQARGAIAKIDAVLRGPEPGALSAASSKPSGAVPLEPQEENREHVETALAELNGLKDADLGRYERECLEAAEGALRRALSIVPLLQDAE